jgi:hypothetical protein
VGLTNSLSVILDDIIIENKVAKILGSFTLLMHKSYSKSNLECFSFTTLSSTGVFYQRYYIESDESYFNDRKLLAPKVTNSCIYPFTIGQKSNLTDRVS